eukprot:GILI01003260.1.p1 GENE.GILI01003260.1~~GILI01003260.1.p1  ORF type:complete len:753 (-),score=277.40 GILI01003260.1:196-2454(-)
MRFILLLLLASPFLSLGTAVASDSATVVSASVPVSGTFLSAGVRFKQVAENIQFANEEASLSANAEVVKSSTVPVTSSSSVQPRFQETASSSSSPSAEKETELVLQVSVPVVHSPVVSVDEPRFKSVHKASHSAVKNQVHSQTASSKKVATARKVTSASHKTTAHHPSASHAAASHRRNFRARGGDDKLNKAPNAPHGTVVPNEPPPVERVKTAHDAQKKVVEATAKAAEEEANDAADAAKASEKAIKSSDSLSKPATEGAAKNALNAAKEASDSAASKIKDVEAKHKEDQDSDKSLVGEVSKEVGEVYHWLFGKKEPTGNSLASSGPATTAPGTVGISSADSSSAPEVHLSVPKSPFPTHNPEDQVKPDTEPPKGGPPVWGPKDPVDDSSSGTKIEPAVLNAKPPKQPEIPTASEISVEDEIERLRAKMKAEAEKKKKDETDPLGVIRHTTPNIPGVKPKDESTEDPDKEPESADATACQHNTPPSKPVPPRLFDSPEDKITAHIADNYREIFNVFDTDGDGFVDRDELDTGFQHLTWDAPKGPDRFAAFDLLLHDHDVDGDDKLSYPEFASMMEEYWRERMAKDGGVCMECFGNSRDQFMALFEWLDRDQDGLIDLDDIAFGFTKLTHHEVTTTMAARALTLCDRDKDGKLDRDEFFLGVIQGNFTPLLPKAKDGEEINSFITQKNKDGRDEKYLALATAAVAVTEELIRDKASDDTDKPHRTIVNTIGAVAEDNLAPTRDKLVQPPVDF